ncbi:VTT domain-containing protein [Patescibacteria group bacterium]|nr:VTT domain-containing protein [Patescibacteria group bacterium]
MDWFSGENLIELIKAVGYLGVFGIVFAESGLFIGFFLPGDSLLFTAGVLASQGYLNIGALLVIIFVGAVLGDNFGYAFGKTVGPKLFRRENSLLFHKKNLIRAQKFYDQYGPATIILARFIPVIRTFAPIVAGVGTMNYKIFVFYNIFGGLIWTLSLTLAGYYLVKIIPGIEDYIHWVVIGIIILSVIPAVWHLLKERLVKK